jgi:hypothetical protein
MTRFFLHDDSISPPFSKFFPLPSWRFNKSKIHSTGWNIRKGLTLNGIGQAVRRIDLTRFEARHLIGTICPVKVGIGSILEIFQKIGTSPPTFFGGAVASP